MTILCSHATRPMASKTEIGQSALALGAAVARLACRKARGAGGRRRHHRGNSERARFAEAADLMEDLNGVGEYTARDTPFGTFARRCGLRDVHWRSADRRPALFVIAFE